MNPRRTDRSGEEATTSEALVAFDLWRAERQGVEGLAKRQHQRLVAHARARSPSYRHLYGDHFPEGIALRALPSVTKRELMSAFDE